MLATEFAFDLSTIEYWRCLLNVACGRGHGLKVAVYSSGADQRVEIIGRLPAKLRAGLKSAFAYWEKPRPGSVSWDDALIVWHTSSDGFGPRYSVQSQDELISLLVARSKAVLGEAK